MYNVQHHLCAGDVFSKDPVHLSAHLGFQSGMGAFHSAPAASAFSEPSPMSACPSALMKKCRAPSLFLVSTEHGRTEMRRSLLPQAALDPTGANVCNQGPSSKVVVTGHYAPLQSRQMK